MWLEDGKANLVRERETPDDLIRHDKPLLDASVAISSITFHKYQGLGNDYIYNLISQNDVLWNCCSSNNSNGLWLGGLKTNGQKYSKQH